jgi:hypothetical protein
VSRTVEGVVGGRCLDSGDRDLRTFYIYVLP